MAAIGRNEPCTCGSGKKHKKCCLLLKPSEQLIRPPVKRAEPAPEKRASTEVKQSTVDDILESETSLVRQAAEKYGPYFENAMAFNGLLSDFIVSINKPDRFVFVMFLSQVRKHHMLALLSAARLHHVQAMMDLRQVLEAGACAAYAIANPAVADFADMDDDGTANPTQALANKRYTWLDANFPAGSLAIKNLKGAINSSSAHSNIVYAQKNFEFDTKSGRFLTPFFDFEEERHVKADLWLVGNIAQGIMDLFFGVDKDQGVIKFREDFVPRLKALEADGNKLKTELMADPAFKGMNEKA